MLRHADRFPSPQLPFSIRRLSTSAPEGLPALGLQRRGSFETANVPAFALREGGQAGEEQQGGCLVGLFGLYSGSSLELVVTSRASTKQASPGRGQLGRKAELCSITF